MAARWIIGVDEVGRGALAGPLTVGAVAVPERALQKLATLRDSKQYSPTQREQLADQLKGFSWLRSAVASVSPRLIDSRGVTFAAQRAVQRALSKVAVQFEGRAVVLLDGGLRAPAHWRQVTVIGGDAQLSIIGAASIVAKVYRDAVMKRQHVHFPQYRFDLHKGYGTRLHYAALKLHGPSSLHRTSFRLTAK